MDKKWIYCVCLLPILQIALAKDLDYFWHLTDLHYDPWYNETYGISCNELKVDGGKYGDYECDSPWELVVSSIKGMRYAGPTPSFILWSGDNPPHVRDAADEVKIDTAMIIELTQNITTAIKTEFPDTMVLPMVGNHDYYPKNDLPGEENDLYNALASMWGDWLDTDDMQNTFKKGAYYSRLISDTPKVRAIVLNTNLYYHSNEATAGQEDPGNQIVWFEQLLANARQSGEKILLISHVPFGKIPEPVEGKGWLVSSFNSYFERAIVENSDVILYTVHIFTHIPPGIIGTNSRMLTPEFIRLFSKLVAQYSDLILGMYGVHTHTDEFRLFLDDNGKAVSSMFVSPSVTPWRVPLDTEKTPPHNPAIRQFYFNTSSYELADYKQYSLNLPLANGGTNEWRETYSFRPYYGVENLGVSELNNLLDDFREFASTKFNNYYDAVYVHTVNEDYRPCGCDCKSSHICAIEFVNYDEFDQCYSEQPACGACAIRGLGLMSVVAVIAMKIAFL